MDHTYPSQCTNQPTACRALNKKQKGALGRYREPEVKHNGDGEELSEAFQLEG